MDIQIINFQTMLSNGGWMGSAKINGRVFTGEFSAVEEYED